MKTQPANLLLALMLGFTGMVFVSTSVMAGSSDDSKKEEKEKEDKEKEEKDQRVKR